MRILGSLLALLLSLGPRLEAQSRSAAQGVPPGYTLLWTEDFSNPRETVSGNTLQKRWSRFFQDGTNPRKTPRILQLGGSGDPDGGEGVQGSLDGKVAAIQIPKGWNPPGSGAPASVRSASFGTPKDVFFRMRFKLAKNYKHWRGSKIGYIYCGTKPPLFLSLNPDGAYVNQEQAETRPVRVRWNTQGALPPTTGPDARDPNRKLSANRGTSEQARLVRGRYHILDTELIGNSPGRADGILRFWIDGVLIAEYTDVGFFGGSVGTATAFSLFAWTPTHDSFDKQPWEEASQQYMDEFTVWVKP